MTITIKREGLKLSLIGGDFPARGSSDVPIQLQSDGSYSGYMITPQFGWYQNGAWKEAAGTYDDGIKLPAQMYRTSGYCYLALALAQTGNAGHVEVTNQIQIPVPLAPHGSSALPDESRRCRRSSRMLLSSIISSSPTQSCCRWSIRSDLYIPASTIPIQGASWAAHGCPSAPAAR